MIPIDQIMGRLGNKMFIYAFMLNYARTHGINDSYFPQHLEWFSESADYIRAIFSNGIGPVIDKVAIHVRRGDYLDPNRIQYALPKEYYTKAMELFPDDKFLVFSDDIAWCKETFGFYNPRIEYSEGKNEIDDLNLMASCKGHIIANSSYSWWAAWLSPLYPENKVVAPLKWDKEDKIFSLPDHWVTI